MIGIGAAHYLTYRCRVSLFADRISRREDPVIFRAGLSNETGSSELRPWDKSNNFAHRCSKHQLENNHEMT